MAAKVETHYLTVNTDRSVSVVSTVAIVAGSVGVDEVEITFSEPADWNSLNLLLTFLHSNGTAVQMTWDGSSRVAIPWEVTQDVGAIGISIVGSLGDVTQRGLTQVASNLLRVVSPGQNVGAPLSEPTSTALDQLIDTLSRIEGSGIVAVARDAHYAAVTYEESNGNLSIIADDEDGVHHVFYATPEGCSYATKQTVEGVDQWTNNWMLTMSTILQAIYPVGSIYANAEDSRNPSEILGFGTWEAIGGRMLIGANSTYPAKSTGGSKTTSIGVANLPQHQHTIQQVWSGDSGSITLSGSKTGLAYRDSGHTTVWDWNRNTGNMTSGGNGTALTTISPYYAVYMWRRTA